MEYNQDLHKGHRPVYCWGHKDLPKISGIASYTISPNRTKPMAGAYRNVIFNTFRRSRQQVFYVVPPFVAAYLIMEWANEKYVILLLAANRRCFEFFGIILVTGASRNRFLNMKFGRTADSDDA